jgi:hypothetical protein
MNFVREGSAALILVALTLSLQCAGMAAVMGKTQLCPSRSQAKNSECGAVQ